MKSAALHQALRKLAERGCWCVDDDTLRKLFPEDRNTYFKALSRFSQQGDIERITPGLYFNPYLSPPAGAAALLASYLRPADDAYVSLESALYERGAITHHPRRLTIMTSGRSWVCATKVGDIDFTHTARDPATWKPRCTFDPERNIYVANLDLAIEDMGRVGRRANILGTEPKHHQKPDTKENHP